MHSQKNPSKFRRLSKVCMGHQNGGWTWLQLAIGPALASWHFCWLCWNHWEVLTSEEACGRLLNLELPPYYILRPSLPKTKRCKANQKYQKYQTIDHQTILREEPRQMKIIDSYLIESKCIFWRFLRPPRWIAFDAVKRGRFSTLPPPGPLLLALPQLPDEVLDSWMDPNLGEVHVLLVFDVLSILCMGSTASKIHWMMMQHWLQTSISGNFTHVSTISTQKNCLCLYVWCFFNFN